MYLDKVLSLSPSEVAAQHNNPRLNPKLVRFLSKLGSTAHVFFVILFARKAPKTSLSSKHESMSSYTLNCKHVSNVSCFQEFICVDVCC